MGGVIALVGLALIAGGWFFHFRLKAKAQSAGKWPTVSGVITDSQVVHKVESDGENGTDDVYYAEPAYRYTVGGREFTSKRVAFGGDTRFTVEQKAREIIDRYSVGATVQVRYNPANPSESVLETKGPSLLMPIVLTVLGVIIAIVRLGKT